MIKTAHFVTGKGGVGKSLISAVLARYFSLQNQQILLTELTEHSFFKDYLELPEISYQPTPWKKNIQVAQWSPEDCLKEYALHLLKIKSLYKLFFENPVSKSLIQVAPGLQELALLGKITSSPRKHGPAMDQDQLVVDAFSTGHFLSLLRAPSAMAEVIHFGPMGEQSRSIDSYIRNPEFTQIHIVTLAEELPITETIELFQQLKSEFNLTARVYLNKLSGLKQDDLSGVSKNTAESLQAIISNEDFAKSTLHKNKIPFIELPLITSIESSVIIDNLCAELKKLNTASLRSFL